jgi:hypothetical protein
VVGTVREGGTVSGKYEGTIMLVNVDIVTAFDHSTGHNSRYVLSSADEPTNKQSITIHDGTGVASAIWMRLVESGSADDFHAAIKRSLEEPGAPQRLGSIEIEENYRGTTRPALIEVRSSGRLRRQRRQQVSAG